jgi:hypothetical protein
MSFSRAAILLTAIGLLAAAGGCLDATTSVELSADGSGTVTEVVYVTQPMERMLGVMSTMALGMLQGNTNATPMATGMVNRVKFETRAAGMGRDVRLVTLAKAERGDGKHGVRAVYAFKDIRQLRLPVDPPYPIPDFGEAPSGETARVTFDYQPSPSPLLTASLPWAVAARKAVQARQTSQPTTPVSEGDSALLRHILDGFRVRLRVSTPSGSVVLYDMDFGTMVRDASLLEQVAALGPARDMNDALGRYAGVSGFKIENQSKVTLRF